MMNWDNTVLVVCGVMVLIAIYFEYRRANKQYLVLRIVVVMLAFVGLLGLIYPFKYTAAVKANGKPKILLTEGFNKDSLASYDSIFTTDPAVHQQYPKAKLVTTASDLATDSTHLSPVKILGYGFDATSLNELKGNLLSFLPSPIPDGFITANWSTELKTGRAFIVQGIYKNTTDKPYQLYLDGLNTHLDSTTIKPGTNTSFALKTTPKHASKAVYKLTVMDGRDTVESQNIPVYIEPAQPIKVMMLSSSPDFEVKFLKDWLTSKGYGVASRTDISKGKFGQDFVNVDQADLSKLSPSMLSKFDAVISDLSSVSSLSTAESNYLQNEISQKGLGLIIRSDSMDKKNGWLQRSFPLIRSGNAPLKPSVLAIAGSMRTAKLNIAPDRIGLKNHSRALVTDDQGKALTASVLSGSGRLIFTTLNDTYTWALSGNKVDYANIWSALLDEALRKLPLNKTWQVDTRIPMPGQQVSITYEGQFPANGVVINQDRVYAAQDASMPFRQSFIYWPEHAGWQQIKPENGTPFWWYAWPKASWKSIVAAQRIAATQKFVDQNKATIGGSHQVNVKTKIPISKIWFFILFLVAATFLWAESKFFSS
ncbi:hypothetical protein [Mucilaginibacter myungsuensis]|uniref:Uncharacterized protein n=1 Tax=Mucilaginibacter myungsuensis TaxID=649104 RepID=A0A929PWV8_9SPHI|nr:hypothetical protein [Mucilaginibacter myungsuensis]MBE9662539.1 hypothetical protein [Mucilaginibacter myungsuensis]MDN3597958.1 hypothetical protein [Mucilaginibacter myungsuensis]